MARLIVAIAVALSPALAIAQQPTRMDVAPRCSRCSIQLRKVATIGSINDSILLSALPRMSRDSKGNFYVAPTAERGKMAVYDAAGRYVKSIGKLGQGPGEYSTYSYHAVGRGDTLHILDNNNRRYTRIPPTGGPAVTVPITLPNSTPLRISASGEILGYTNRTPTRIPSVAIFAPDGTEKSRTATTPPLDGLPPMGNTETVLVPDAGAVWVLPANRYSMEKWSLDGRRLESLTRSVPWFTPWTTFTPYSALGKEPTPTRMFDAFIDDLGYMWTVFWTAEQDFKPLGPDVRVGTAEMAKIMDTQTEVINVVTKTVLVSQRFPELLQPVAGTDYVFSIRQKQR